MVWSRSFSLTPAHPHTFTHTNTHILTPSHPHTLTPSHPHTLTPSHTNILTPSHTNSLTPSHPHVGAQIWDLETGKLLHELGGKPDRNTCPNSEV